LSDSAAIEMARRELPHSQLRWGPKVGLMLANMLQRAARDFVGGRNLANEALSLLEKWEHFNLGRDRRQFETRGTGSPEPDAAGEVSERLMEVLSELQRLADRIREDMNSVTSSTGRVEPPRPRSLLFEPARELARRFDMPPTLETDRWSDTIGVEAGPWALQLSGTALPAPELAVTLCGADEKTAPVEPFLTLVSPKQGFETANVDSDGHVKVALPQGDSVLLVQGDEVWEVRLNYRAT
jgi:hypothetical protein